MLENLNDPVHPFNQTVTSYTISETNCQHGKYLVDCYQGYINAEYNGSFVYENNTYDNVIFNYTVYITSYLTDQYSSSDACIQAMHDYLVATYPINVSTMVNVNICQINSYYTNICTYNDQQLTGLIQTWSTPPISQAYADASPYIIAFFTLVAVLCVGFVVMLGCFCYWCYKEKRSR